MYHFVGSRIAWTEISRRLPHLCATILRSLVAAAFLRRCAIQFARQTLEEALPETSTSGQEQLRRDCDGKGMGKALALEACSRQIHQDSLPCRISHNRVFHAIASRPYRAHIACTCAGRPRTTRYTFAGGSRKHRDPVQQAIGGRLAS